MAAIIGQLRESPEDFAGYYMVTLVDPWTFTWGVVDAAWNAKLAYFVVAGCYGRAWVSALHGSARIERSSAPLSVTASVYGGAVKGASLSVKVKDQAGSTARAVDITRLDLPAHGVNVTAATVEVADLPLGTYSIEHELKTRDGGTLARLLELFILR
jgi:hypothetical protein